MPYLEINLFTSDLLTFASPRASYGGALSFDQWEIENLGI